MTLALKFLLCLNGKIFDFKKTSLRYYGFSVATNVSCEIVGKGVCITRMGYNCNIIQS